MSIDAYRPWYACDANPCTCPKPEPTWSAEEAVAALLALCGVYDAKAPAHRYISTRLIREAITGERGA